MVRVLPDCPVCGEPMSVVYKQKLMKAKKKSSFSMSWEERACKACGYVTSTEPKLVETTWT